jgi:Caspase domain
MLLVFRKLPPAESLTPQPGELYLIPALPAQRPRRDIARFVLEHGKAALLQSSVELERIVLDSDPKLDDMLAALFVQVQSEGRELSPGCRAFADYAAAIREGQRPAPVPLEESLEGVYLAMRGLAEKSLTDADTARQFLADWERLAAVILAAAAEGKDPATAQLLGASVGFAGGRTNALRSINWGKTSVAQAGLGFLREQAFLAKDLAIFREDAARGVRWRIRLPGAAAGWGLVLRDPKSLLFKYWAKSPCPPPAGGPHQLLAVAPKPGHWVIAVDPGLGVSLKPLAEQLQAAETKAVPDLAGRDPWFASPRAGTRLTEQQVLRVVGKWSHAKPAEGGGLPLRRISIVGVAAVLLAAAAYFALPSSHKQAKPALDVHDLFVLSIGVSNYKTLPPLQNAAGDADSLAAAFQGLEGTLCKKVYKKVMKNEEATRNDIIRFGLDSWLLHNDAISPTTHSLVVVTFSGHGFVEAATKRYHFAPQDYDMPDPGSTGLFLADIQRYLESLPCTAVLIFDTCHSGAVENNTSDPNSPDNFFKTIHKFVSEAENKKGLVVMAACAGSQKANEAKRWGHGALTLSLLEAIGGKYLYQSKDLPQTPLPSPEGSKWVTLVDVDRYVTDRVHVLSSEISDPRYRQQSAKTYCTGNISLEQIPFAVAVAAAGKSERGH